MSSDFWFPPNPKSDTTYFNEHRANENMYCFLQKKYYALTWNVPPWLTHLINNFWNQPLFTSFFLFIEIWEYFSQNIVFPPPSCSTALAFQWTWQTNIWATKKEPLEPKSIDQYIDSYELFELWVPPLNDTRICQFMSSGRFLLKFSKSMNHRQLNLSIDDRSIWIID